MAHSTKSARAMNGSEAAARSMGSMPCTTCTAFDNGCAASDPCDTALKPETTRSKINLEPSSWGACPEAGTAAEAAAAAGAEPARPDAGAGASVAKSPSQLGMMRLIRSKSGGWEAKTPLSALVSGLLISMWLESCALGAERAELSEAILARALAMPQGLRVNCTAEASARNSLCCETAA